MKTNKKTWKLQIATPYTDTEDAKDRLLTRKEAAELLGVAVDTLNIWHSKKRYNIPVVKVGHLAKYKLSDLMAFIARRTVGGADEQ